MLESLTLVSSKGYLAVKINVNSDVVAKVIQGQGTVEERRLLMRIQSFLHQLVDA